jgi:hypothetical protein
VLKVQCSHPQGKDNDKYLKSLPEGRQTLFADYWGISKY